MKNKYDAIVASLEALFLRFLALWVRPDGGCESFRATVLGHTCYTHSINIALLKLAWFGALQQTPNMSQHRVVRISGVVLTTRCPHCSSIIQLTGARGMHRLHWCSYLSQSEKIRGYDIVVNIWLYQQILRFLPYYLNWVSILLFSHFEFCDSTHGM